jgi:hypothetical protein
MGKAKLTNVAAIETVVLPLKQLAVILVSLSCDETGIALAICNAIKTLGFRLYPYGVDFGHYPV